MDDEDFDTHICLGCQATIVGLESYVQHKKFECPAKKTATPGKPVRSTQPSSTVPAFSVAVTSGVPSLVTSVELQVVDSVTTSLSSAVLSVDVTSGDDGASALSPNSGSTVSMIGPAMGANVFSPSSSRVVDPNMVLYSTRPPEDADPPVNWSEFFSSLELQSRGPAEKQKVGSASKDLKVMGDVQKVDPAYQVDSFDQDQSKNLRIVNLLNDLDFSSDSEGFLPSDAEDLLNFSDVDDMEEPPHTGGKWKPGTHPSPSHTRGKWRPGTKPMPSHPRPRGRPPGKGRGKNLSKLEAFEKQKEKETDTSKAESKGKTMSQPRPRSGKKQINYAEDSGDEDEDEDAMQEAETEQAEEIMTNDERAEEEGEKEMSAPDAEVNNTGMGAAADGDGEWVAEANVGQDFLITKKVKLPVNIQCHVCSRTFNNKYRFVRHLASSYHIRREKVANPPYILEESFQKLLLRQKPFQCHVCSFFCNEATVLHSHMKSDDHLHATATMLGPLLCVRCKFSCSSNGEMLQHLSLAEHEKTVMESRRPCIIKEIRKEVACPTCKVVKHSAMALAKHMKVSHGRCLDKVELRKYRHKAGIFSRLCPHCGKQCANHQVLSLHIRRRHTNERPHRCTHCDVGFAESVGLRIHLRSKKHAKVVAKLGDLNSDITWTATNTQQTQSKKCRFCDFRSHNALESRFHITVAHPDMVQYCDLCGVSFDMPAMYEKHMKGSVHKKQLERSQTADCKPMECTSCGKKFYDVRLLKMHTLSHTQITSESKLKELSGDPLIGIAEKYHDFVKSLPMLRKHGDHKDIECPECKMHLRSENMISHIRKHSGSQPFVCVYCSKRFTSAYFLNRHLKQHLGLDNFKCETCGKEFRQRVFLRTHMLRKHNDPETRRQAHTCEICGLAFIHKNQLKLHVQRHLGKKIKCTWPDCRLAFMQPSELEGHMRTHTNHRPFLCDFCGYSAKMKNQLTRHRRKHTGERPFACEYCSFKALNSTNLRRHMRIHIGTKPFKCPHCDYRCNTLENVRKHIKNTKRHAGLPIYPCRMCSFGTNDSKTFRNHLEDIHQINTKTTDVISVYSGLYDKETDIRKVPEGSQALPCREFTPSQASPPKPKAKPQSKKPRMKTEAEVGGGDKTKNAKTTVKNSRLPAVKKENTQSDHAYSTAGFMDLEPGLHYQVVQQVEVETTPAEEHVNIPPLIYYTADMDPVYMMSEKT